MQNRILIGSSDSVPQMDYWPQHIKISMSLISPAHFWNHMTSVISQGRQDAFVKSRVGRIMLNFSPIPLCYSNCNMLKILPIMLLCLLLCSNYAHYFWKGQICTLKQLHYSAVYNITIFSPISNQVYKPTGRSIPADYMDYTFNSHYVRTLSPGPALSMGWDTSQPKTGTQGLDTVWG